MSNSKNTFYANKTLLNRLQKVFTSRVYDSTIDMEKDLQWQNFLNSLVKEKVLTNSQYHSVKRWHYWSMDIVKPGDVKYI